jgi:hypothetical protein
MIVMIPAEHLLPDDFCRGAKASKRLLALTIILLSAASCGATREAQSPRPSIIDDSIIVLPGAQDVHRSNQYSGVTEFTVDDGYPAFSTRRAFDQRLAQAGWRQSTSDLFNPSRPEDLRQWGVAVSNGKRTSSWSGQWENASGDVLIVSLSYSGTVGGGDVSVGADITPAGPLKVRIVQISADIAARLKAALK